MKVALVESNLVEIELSADYGKTFHPIHNVSQYTESEGTVPTTQKATLSGTSTVVGKEQPSSISLNLEYRPNDKVNDIIHDAYVNQSLVHVRWSTKERFVERLERTSLYIDKLNRKVYLEKTDQTSKYTNGYNLRIGSVLLAISDNEAQIASKDYIECYFIDDRIDIYDLLRVDTKELRLISPRIVIPKITRPIFTARMTNAIKADITSDDSVSSTISMQATSLLENIKIPIENDIAAGSVSDIYEGAGGGRGLNLVMAVVKDVGNTSTANDIPIRVEAGALANIEYVKSDKLGEFSLGSVSGTSRTLSSSLVRNDAVPGAGCAVGSKAIFISRGAYEIFDRKDGAWVSLGAKAEASLVPPTDYEVVGAFYDKVNKQVIVAIVINSGAVRIIIKAYTLANDTLTLVNGVGVTNKQITGNTYFGTTTQNAYDITGIAAYPFKSVSDGEPSDWLLLVAEARDTMIEVGLLLKYRGTSPAITELIYLMRWQDRTGVEKIGSGTLSKVSGGSRFVYGAIKKTNKQLLIESIYLDNSNRRVLNINSQTAYAERTNFPSQAAKDVLIADINQGDDRNNPLIGIDVLKSGVWVIPTIFNY